MLEGTGSAYRPHDKPKHGSDHGCSRRSVARVCQKRRTGARGVCTAFVAVVAADRHLALLGGWVACGHVVGAGSSSAKGEAKERRESGSSLATLVAHVVPC